MEKTRILALAPIGGFSNGADISLDHQILHLKSLGYEICLARPDLSNPDFDVFLEKQGIDQLLLPYNYWDDAELNQLFSAHQDMEATQTLIKVIQEKEIDLVISCTLNIPWGAFAAAFANCPHIWLAHEFPENEFSYLKNRLAFVSKFSNSILTASPLLAKALSRYYEEAGNSEIAIDNFYPYTDVSKLQISSETGKTRLVNVNALNPRKNQMELLEALKALRLEGIDLELLFTGYVAEEAYYQKMLEFIEENDLKNHVKFDSEGLNNWQPVRRTDIFVNPTINEVFSLTIVEALKLSIPILAPYESTEAFQALSYLDDSNLYHLGNVSELVKKIKEALNQGEKLREKSQQLSEKVNQEQSLAACSLTIVSEIERLKSQPHPVKELSEIADYFVNGISEYLVLERETIPNLQKELTKLARLRESEILSFENQIRDWQARLADFENSRSYKLGAFLTSPYRKLKSILKK